MVRVSLSENFSFVRLKWVQDLILQHKKKVWIGAKAGERYEYIAGLYVYQTMQNKNLYFAFNLSFCLLTSWGQWKRRLTNILFLSKYFVSFYISWTFFDTHITSKHPIQCFCFYISWHKMDSVFYCVVYSTNVYTWNLARLI